MCITRTSPSGKFTLCLNGPTREMDGDGSCTEITIGSTASPSGYPKFKLSAYHEGDTRVIDIGRPELVGFGIIAHGMPQRDMLWVILSFLDWTATHKVTIQSAAYGQIFTSRRTIRGVELSSGDGRWFMPITDDLTPCINMPHIGITRAEPTIRELPQSLDLKYGLPGDLEVRITRMDSAWLRFKASLKSEMWTAVLHILEDPRRLCVLHENLTNQDPPVPPQVMDAFRFHVGALMKTFGFMTVEMNGSVFTPNWNDVV